MQSLHDQLTQILDSKVAQMFHVIPNDVASGVLDGARIAVGEPLPNGKPRGALSRSVARIVAPRIQELINEITNSLCDDTLLYFSDLSEEQALTWTTQTLNQILADLRTAADTSHSDEGDNNQSHDTAITSSTRGTTTNGAVMDFLQRNNWHESSGKNGHRVFRHASGHSVPVGKNPTKELKLGTQNAIFKQIGEAMAGTVFLNGSKITFTPATASSSSGVVDEQTHSAE